MRRCLPLVALAVALAAAACSSGESAPVHEAGGTEAELRGAVDQYAGAFLDGDYADAYHLHTSEWQRRCPIGDWLELMRVQKQTLSDQIVGAGGEMSTARFVITAAEHDGSQGVHQGYVEINGKSYPFGDQDRPGGMYWVWQEGSWQATDDRERPCETGAATP